MPTTPPRYSFERRFVDFDQLACQARQWDLDLRQIDRGVFRGELLQFGLDDVHISEARFGRALIQAGTPPAGLRTIAIAARAGVRFKWRGQDVDSDQLAVFPRGGELSSVSKPCFHVYTCSFSEERLATVLAPFEIERLEDLTGDTGVVRCSRSAMASLRACLKEICVGVRGGGWASMHGDAGASRAQVELPQRIARALVESSGASVANVLQRRERAMTSAEKYIERFAGDDVSIADVVAASNVSQRTLEYAFMDRYGLTPKQYLMAYRLNMVRRALQSSEAVGVADVANRWGFWHMGQFASDYRRHFGELPSKTLRSASRPGQAANGRHENGPR